MYISRLSIRNFRNFKNVKLNFTKGINTVIGENGSGKTNLFKALRILIDENMPRATKFYENDFNRSLEDWRGHWIAIQIEFSELSTDEEIQAIVLHNIGKTMEDKGIYTVYFRPNLQIRRELYELSESKVKSKEELYKILNLISTDNYEVIFTGRSEVDLSEEANYHKYVGDFENITFPNPDDEQTDIYGVKMNNILLPNEFSCTFAKALRDVEADLRSFKGNPLLNLLKNNEKNIEISKKLEIEDQIKDLNDSITELKEVKEISTGISDSINNAVGETYAPNIKIKSELPSETEKLFTSLKLWVSESGESNYEGRLWELSLGGANLIYLSLKLLEFEKDKYQNKVANFILIEEPEAHIHTHIQKTLFQNLKKEKTQVFISTHSTHISSVSKIGSMNILGKNKNKTIVFNPSNGLEPTEIIKLERYLDVARSNLLFAKSVVLVEGDAEQILIPCLIKEVLGISLDELGISLINIGSTGFQNVAQIFSDSRIKRRCSILTDNDLSIVDLDGNEDDYDDYEKKCLNSQKSGEIRKKALEKFSQNNQWIKPFYAKHTFEVDFLMEDNSFETIKTITPLYKINKDGSKSRALKKAIKLLNDEDVAISGKKILAIAENNGKGWFAIMLSENITNLTFIPKYILDALCFVCSEIPESTLVRIAKFRLTSFIQNRYKKNIEDYEGMLESFNLFESPIEKLKFFKKNLPDDVFSTFMKGIDHA